MIVPYIYEYWPGNKERENLSDTIRQQIKKLLLSSLVCGSKGATNRALEPFLGF